MPQESGGSLNMLWQRRLVAMERQLIMVRCVDRSLCSGVTAVVYRQVEACA
jgi:hypothetical protein